MGSEELIVQDGSGVTNQEGYFPRPDSPIREVSASGITFAVDRDGFIISRGTGSDVWEVSNPQSGAEGATRLIVKDKQKGTLEIPDEVVAVASGDIYGQTQIVAAQERLDVKNGPRRGAPVHERGNTVFAVTNGGTIVFCSKDEWDSRFRERHWQKANISENKDTKFGRVRTLTYPGFRTGGAGTFPVQEDLPDELVAFANSKIYSESVAGAVGRLGGQKKWTLSSRKV